MMKDQKASSFHFHSCVAAESDGLTHWPKGLCSITFIAETEIEKNLGLGFTHTRRHTLLPSAHALTCVRTVNSQRMPAFLPVCLTGWTLWATFDMNTV